MLPKYYEFVNSVKILSGTKALENIAFELANFNAKNPLLLSDKVLDQIGTVDIVVNAIAESVKIKTKFTDIPADSSIKVVNDILSVYKANNCDSIIAVGGGSVIDTAKGVKMLASQEIDDIMTLMGCQVIKKGKVVPFIVVPTTSGTGSECTMVAVIANPEKNVKMEFISYELLPDVAVLDVRMTESLPPKMTASTGMDALCHAIEGYTCMQKNPLSDAYAISAIRLIGEYLQIAVEKGNDKQARVAMMNASLMAGISFSNSMVGLVHAIGHACGGVAHVPHGDAMSILLPYVMEYNMEKLGYLYADILLYLGGAEVYAATPKEKRGQKAVEIVRGMSKLFNEKCKLPLKLSDCRVTADQLETIALKATNDGAIIVNPVEATKEEILEILKKAF